MNYFFVCFGRCPRTGPTVLRSETSPRSGFRRPVLRVVRDQLLLFDLVFRGAEVAADRHLRDLRRPDRGFRVGARPLGRRHVGLCRVADRRQELHPALQGTPHRPHFHHSTRFRRDQRRQFLVVPSCLRVDVKIFHDQVSFFGEHSMDWID